MTDYPNEIARLDAQRRKNHDATAYEELDKAYTESGHTVFIMALNALISLGRDTVAAMAHPAAIAATIQGNIFSEDFKLEVGRIALMMANADIDVLLAVIQRTVVPFTDPQGKRIPFLHPNGDEEDVCPACGAEVEYLGDLALRLHLIVVYEEFKQYARSEIAIYRKLSPADLDGVWERVDK